MKSLKSLGGKLAGSNKALAAGTGGSIGLAAAAGTCAAGVCGVAVFPVAGFLSSIGLGGIIPWLPGLQIPLLLVATGMSFLVIRNVNRQRNPLRSSLVGMVLGSILTFSVIQAFILPAHSQPQPADAEPARCTADPLLRPNADHMPEF